MSAATIDNVIEDVQNAQTCIVKTPDFACLAALHRPSKKLDTERERLKRLKGRLAPGHAGSSYIVAYGFKQGDKDPSAELVSSHNWRNTVRQIFNGPVRLLNYVPLGDNCGTVREVTVYPADKYSKKHIA